MIPLFSYILLGLAAGAFSGLLGIGGGVIIVPVLVYMFHLSQQMAQGTTLALLVPPIGLLAAWSYYKSGHVDFRIALLICVGFLIGGLFGAKISNALPTAVLQKIFGIGLLLIGFKMLLLR